MFISFLFLVGCLLLLIVSVTGKFVYHGTESNHMYVSPNMELTNKIHHIAVPTPNDCACVGAADVTKAHLIDYIDALELIYSFSFFVDSGDNCELQKEDMAYRTRWKVNFVNLRQTGFNKGTVLYRGMKDFYRNPYIVENSEEIFSTDKSGGIMMTWDNIELRPCRLFPWFMPWIYTHNSTKTRVNFSNGNYSGLFGADEMEMFFGLYEDLVRQNLIKAKHTVNLEDNTGNSWLIDSFDLDAVFIPHRFANEFMQLLGPFAETDLSPQLYVPFVIQSMFDRNEWIFMSDETHSGTIRVASRPLLDTCKNVTADQMDVNVQAARSLYNYGFFECGGIFAEIEHAIVVIEEITGQSAQALGIALIVMGLIVCCGALAFVKQKEFQECFSYIIRKTNFRKQRFAPYYRKDSEDFVAMRGVSKDSEDDNEMLILEDRLK